MIIIITLIIITTTTTIIIIMILLLLVLLPLHIYLYGGPLASAGKKRIAGRFLRGRRRWDGGKSWVTSILAMTREGYWR